MFRQDLHESCTGRTMLRRMLKGFCTLRPEGVLAAIPVEPALVTYPQQTWGVALGLFESLRHWSWAGEPVAWLVAGCTTDLPIAGELGVEEEPVPQGRRFRVISEPVRRIGRRRRHRTQTQNLPESGIG